MSDGAQGPAFDPGTLDLDALLVEPGSAPRLGKRRTRLDLELDKRVAREALQATVAEIATLQERLYARGTNAVLLVFQALDAAGKDSTIAHVLSGVNPQGCAVTSFNAPTADELAHDFLWRVGQALPARGHIGVFNRSHYEETVVVRVHPELLEPQHLPGLRDDPSSRKELWTQRYEDINAFERHLDRNGTIVVKFFLHVSKDEQRKRLLARLDNPAKHWKFNAADLSERERWSDYMKAYEDTLTNTSTAWAPWRVIPADDKPLMRLLVARVLLEALQGVELVPPTPTLDEQAAMDEARAQLLSED